MHLGVAADDQNDQDAGQKHAPGGGVTGIGEQRREQKRRDDREIEQNGSAGRGGEPAIGVEDAGKQRLNRDKREIGTGDAGQRDGEIEADRIVGKTRREQADDFRRKKQSERERDEVENDQRSGDLVGEELCGRQARLLESARISRHEGGSEGAFGEDGAEMVGQPEGDEEGVGHRSGAEDRGHDHVTNEAGEARDEREAADSGDTSDHVVLESRRTTL